MTVTELRARKAELVKTIRDLADKNKDENYEWTDADERSWTAANAEIDEVQRDIESGGTGSDAYGREDVIPDFGVRKPHSHPDREYFRNTESGRLVPVVRGKDSYEDAILEMRGERLTEQQKALEGMSLGTVLRALATGAESDQERRALSEGVDSAGGYTVPSILSAQLVDLMRKKTRTVEAGAGLMPLDGEKLNFAKILTDATAAWRAEAGSVAVSAPTFGNVQFAPKSLAVLVKASQELLEDSTNVETALMHSLSHSLGSEIDRVALLGSGSGNEPTGLANMSGGINELSMGTNGSAISDYTDVLDAVKLLQDDNAGTVSGAIMAPRTHRVFAGLADTTGQPLRRPFTLEGVPFLETGQIGITDTQGTASDASKMFLGDFSDLIIGMRSRMRIDVLRERYADTMEIGFLASIRVDIQAWREQSLCRIVGIIP